MTLRIEASRLKGLGFDFVEVVEAYRAAMLAHRFTVDEPAPAAHPFVAAAVRRVPTENGPDDFVADYEIIDDTPPPPTLRQRKNELLDLVSRHEHAALQAITPIGKARLYGMLRDEITAINPTARSAEQTAFLAADDERAARSKRVMRLGAEMHAEIEDLTEGEIDEWLVANGRRLAGFESFLMTTTGAGDGATTFNLPDPKGRARLSESTP